MSSKPQSDQPVVLELVEQDDYASLRYRLSILEPGRVALVVPWDMAFLSRLVEFDLLKREAGAQHIELAIVSADPERCTLARAAGLPTFGSVASALRTARWHARPTSPVAPPRHHWWDEPVDLRPRAARRHGRWVGALKIALRVAVFLLAVAVLVAAAYVVVPRADITLRPAGRDFTTIVLVSVDPDTDEVDLARRIIPARRVGIEVEGTIEVATSGLMDVATGKAVGEVLFTNLLTQDFVVPAGTVVRTSSTSYPVRFSTNAAVTVPAGGQATVGIQALDEGIGNVGAYQINQVEGAVGSAVRVINPQSTTGAEPQEKRAVVQADYDRARTELMRQLLDQAHYEMGRLELLLPTEFVPRDSLVIQSVPKEAYSRFIGEQAETVGLNMRLLVSGLAVDSDNAEAVAYAELVGSLPPEFVLVDERFEIGEMAEEDIGEGQLALFVTAHGYAAATLNADEAAKLVRNLPVEEARERLMAEMPLAQPPVVAVWPQQMKRVPWLPLRIKVAVRNPAS